VALDRGDIMHVHVRIGKARGAQAVPEQGRECAVVRRHPVPVLTARHWQLLGLLAAGHTNAQIARRLGLSEGTVRTHLEHIYRRLNVSSRAAAVTRAFPDRDA
jgi:DNA-binding NarL/FixJ family response regulator